ncbi:UDP-N-acetylmuramate--L-alanine ligase [Candidatus Gottesmanbacteria bacterium]|nr:UDP-N-acetylmuramate--L-alanine ligase [Candidatus Gottesmanbacteria bacterium]
MIDIEKAQDVYFVGIKGVAMTALALYLRAKGVRVSGSDVKDRFPTDEMLLKFHIPVLEGFTSEHIDSLKKIDLLIYTGAHDGQNNSEVLEAQRLGIPILPHGKALGLCMESSKQISVGGSHGKTTTSAMIATVLSLAKKSPSYAIGCGEIFPLNAPGTYGKGEWFVAEADEYATDPKYDKTPRFLFQHPDIFAVTNIDYDHPDIYADIASVQKAFVSMKSNLRGLSTLVVNADDPKSVCLRQDQNGTIVTFGTGVGSDYQILDTTFLEGETEFMLLCPEGTKHMFRLKIPGIHNVLNAVCAVAVLRLCGLTWKEIYQGLLKFHGTKRRFEYIGSIGKCIFYDDYAHHPNEILATLSGARKWYPDRKIYCIFQAHTYTRTKALLSQFARAFSDADSLVLVDIYASAREIQNDGMTGEILARECKKHHKDVHFVRNENGVLSFLSTISDEKAVFIFMGAGDIYLWGRRILDALKDQVK